MPFSPLGKGFLTGAIDETPASIRTTSATSCRASRQENRKANQALVDAAGTDRRAEAGDAGADRARLAAGAEALDRADPRHHQAASAGREHRRGDIELTRDDLREIEGVFSKITVQGDRYPARLQARVGR